MVALAVFRVEPLPQFIVCLKRIAHLHSVEGNEVKGWYLPRSLVPFQFSDDGTNALNPETADKLSCEGSIFKQIHCSLRVYVPLSFRHQEALLQTPTLLYGQVTFLKWNSEGMT